MYYKARNAVYRVRLMPFPVPRNVALALVRGGTIMRCSENPIGDPPLFRVVLNYAMFARPGLKGGGPGSQKPKNVLNKNLRSFWVSSLI